LASKKEENPLKAVLIMSEEDRLAAFVMSSTWRAARGFDFLRRLQDAQHVLSDQDALDSNVHKHPLTRAQQECADTTEKEKSRSSEVEELDNRCVEMHEELQRLRTDELLFRRQTAAREVELNHHSLAFTVQ
jgi:hypothetical protein